MFSFYDSSQGRIDTYKIQEPKINLPSFDYKNYSAIKKKFGEKFMYAFNVSNGAGYYFTQYNEMDRGKFSQSSTGGTSGISSWFVVLIILGVLLLIVLVVFCAYKYFWKRRKQKEKIELVVNTISFNYSLN